jgi:hypothetical protein
MVILRIILRPIKLWESDLLATITPMVKLPELPVPVRREPVPAGPIP